MRAPIAVAVALLGGLGIAQDPTATLFLNDEGEYGYEASIVSAYSSVTIYELKCTSAGSSASYYLDCSDDAIKFRITEGPSTLALSSSRRVLVDDTTVTAGYTETCVMLGTRAANCSGELSGSSKHATVASTTTTVILTSNIFNVQVPITGGADKTATPAPGTPTPGAAAPTNANGVMAMGVAGVAGLAGLLAL